MPEGKASSGKLRQRDSAAIQAAGEKVGGGQEDVASGVWSAVKTRSEPEVVVPWRPFAAAGPVSKLIRKRRGGMAGYLKGVTTALPRTQTRSPLAPSGQQTHA